MNVTYLFVLTFCLRQLKKFSARSRVSQKGLILEGEAALAAYVTELKNMSKERSSEQPTRHNAHLRLQAVGSPSITAGLGRLD